MSPITPQWLDQAFTSRTQAETILRPYLDVGTITEHDYNLAVSFLPGSHRYWPAAYSAGATVLTVAYGRYARTPKWSSRRTWAFGIAANVLGLFVGQVKRASAHAQFVKSLDNPPGFLTALHEIAAGDTPPRPSGAAVDPTRPEGTEEYGSKVTPNDADSAWATADQRQIATRTASAPTETPRPSSRWDEIRSANARGAKPSSWDTLRQGHEKAQAQVSDNLNSTQPPFVATDANAERAREQAHFDAALEAERKAARG